LIIIVTTFKTIYKTEHGLAVRNARLQLDLSQNRTRGGGGGGGWGTLLVLVGGNQTGKKSSTLNRRRVASVAFPAKAAESKLLKRAEM
jgi:hypothetical protein